MTDPRREEDPETPPPSDAVGSGDGEIEEVDGRPEAARDPMPDRRTFLHQLSRDAAWTAGRVAGFSSMVRRSVFAAGEAAALGFERPSGEDPATLTPEPQPPVGLAPSSPPAVVVAPSPPRVVRDPVSALSPAQHDFLARMPKAALAVNDPAGAPHVTSSNFHWDGTTIRLPAQQFTLRASNVERDPHVSLLIEDTATDAWVAVTGMASVVYGADVDAGMLLLLAKDADEDVSVLRWEEMRASGGRIVIEVRPTRFVWRSA